MDKQNALVIITASPVALFSVEVVNNEDYAQKYESFNCPLDILFEYFVEHEEYDYKKFIIAGGPQNYIDHIVLKLKEYYPDAEYVQ